MGFFGVLLEIVDQDADALGRVPRGLKEAEADIAELQGAAVRFGLEVEVSLGMSPEVNRGAGALAQVQVAGEKVGVKVGQKDVADLQVPILCFLKVLINVALGVDNDSRPALFVSDQVGGVGQTAQEVLVKDHGNGGGAKVRSKRSEVRTSSPGGREPSRGLR